MRKRKDSWSNIGIAVSVACCGLGIGYGLFVHYVDASSFVFISKFLNDNREYIPSFSHLLSSVCIMVVIGCLIRFANSLRQR